MRRSLSLLLLVAAGCRPPVADGPRPVDLFAPDAAERIARIESSVGPGDGTAVPLPRRMEQLNVPAVSVAVFEDGRLAWAKAWGMADRETVRPAATGTLFQAASISKPVAAAAMLSMVEEGLLDLDADVNTFLSSWHLPDNGFTRSEAVTLRRLASHTAGTTVSGFPGYARTDSVPSTVAVLEGEGNTPPVRVFREPGTAWQYSGGGYTVMQLAMEDVGALPFPDLVRARVLDPAGMTESGYLQPLPAAYHARAATGHREDGTAVAGGWHTYPEMAAAGLWTTPSDLARFAIALQGDLAGARTVLGPETVREMLTPGMEEWGLGPRLYGNGLWFGHGGANEGFRCVLKALVDGRGGVAVMVNSDSGELLGEIVDAVSAEYGWPDS